MPRVLVVAPATEWVAEIDMFGGTGVLVLDELLMAGLAGVYFRRLKVSAAVHPAMRVEYERKRFAYLQSAVAVLDLPKDLVVVGSHPTDVDLMEYEQVCAVKVVDAGLRDMSKLVYGDSMMLYVEYMSVLRTLDDAVDVWHHVNTWHEVPLWLMREFGRHDYVMGSLSPAKQREILAVVLDGEADAAVWLEDDLHLDLPMRKGFLVADYDYLTVIKPKWRDAVVRTLGSAPGVGLLFRLPWFMVDSAALDTLCYRPNLQGRPTVSTRGRSLVEFVRLRLPSVYTTRELVGTWIGGFLCDDVTAVDTLRTLGLDSLVPVGAVDVRGPVLDRQAVCVPPEYAWMYEAVLDVKVVPWDGAKRPDGTLRADTASADVRWAVTLPLAELYASVVDQPRLAVAVVQLFQRLHTVWVGSTFVQSLTAHARDVLNDGPVYEVFDPGLTPLLPGYNHLFCFVSSARYRVLDELGSDPSWARIVEYVSARPSEDGLVSIDQLYADVARLSLYAGRPMHVAYGLERVGFRDKQERPGYCYDCMFVDRYKRRARVRIKAYPSLFVVLDRKYASWWIPHMYDRVYVTYSDVTLRSEMVLHFSLSPSGGRVTLRVLVNTLRAEKRLTRDSVRTMRVGQAAVCYSSTWYVAAIIAWTIVGCFVFGVIVWLTYVRCTRGAGRRRY